MGIIKNQYVTVTWQRGLTNHLKSFGYKFTRIGDEVNIKVEHLRPTSHTYVKVECDYCGKIKDVVYKTVVHKEKYRCKKCAGKQKYTQVEVQTFLEDRSCKLLSEYVDALSPLRFRCKCGDEDTRTFNQFQYNPMCHNCSKSEGKIKRTETFKTKYGYENPFASPEVREKIRKGLMEKYGTINVQSLIEVRLKTMKTNIKKYGVPFVMQNRSIINKARNTLSQHGEVKDSYPQRYLYKIIGGEYNHEIGGVTVDIALLEDKICVEYDGGGHRLPVKIGKMTKIEFDNMERKREKFLIGEGWKIIRFISEKDKLPTPNIVKNLFQEAFELLNSGRSYFEINIDNSVVKCKLFKKNIKLGKLKKIRSEKDFFTLLNNFMDSQ